MKSFFPRGASLVFVFFLIFTITSPFPVFPSPAGGQPPLPDARNRSFILGVVAGTYNARTNDKTASARLIEQGRKTTQERIVALLEKKKGAELDYTLPSPKATFVKILRQEEALPSGTAKRPLLWLETEGTFTLKNPKTGREPESEVLDREGFFDIRLWTDQKEYKDGQKITLYLQGNRDFQGKIIKIDPKGNVSQILPNNYRQLSYFEKGKRYLLPDEGDRYQLTSQPPFGTIRFIVYASPLPMSQVNLTTAAGGIFRYRSSEKFFGRSVRHIIPSGEEQIAEFHEALWEIKTVAGR